MAQMIPVIGQIIVSVLVSKLATQVSSKIGLSDSMAGLVGIGAGLYAGGMAGEAMAPTPTGSPAPTVGMDLNAGITGSAVATPDDMSNIAASTPLADPLAVTPATPTPGGIPAPVTTTPAVTPAPVVKPLTTPPPAGGNWWDKILGSQKGMDTLVGAAGGMAQGYMQGEAADDAYKARNKRDDEMSARWANYDMENVPGLAYPDKAKTGMLTRGMR